MAKRGTCDFNENFMGFRRRYGQGVEVEFVVS